MSRDLTPHQRQDLDNYITGHYGEDQFRDSCDDDDELIDIVPDEPEKTSVVEPLHAFAIVWKLVQSGTQWIDPTSVAATREEVEKDLEGRRTVIGIQPNITARIASVTITENS